MNCRRLQSYLEALYKRTAEALLPLYERMIEQIMQCDILHADETFIKLMIKGTKKCKQAYYIAPIGKCAKLRESEKGAFNGHQETMDGQRKTCNRAAGLEGGMQRQ